MHKPFNIWPTIFSQMSILVISLTWISSRYPFCEWTVTYIGKLCYVQETFDWRLDLNSYNFLNRMYNVWKSAILNKKMVATLIYFNTNTHFLWCFYCTHNLKGFLFPVFFHKPSRFLFTRSQILIVITWTSKALQRLPSNNTLQTKNYTRETCLVFLLPFEPCVQSIENPQFLIQNNG